MHALHPELVVAAGAGVLLSAGGLRRGNRSDAWSARLTLAVLIAAAVLCGLPAVTSEPARMLVDDALSLGGRFCCLLTAACFALAALDRGRVTSPSARQAGGLLLATAAGMLASAAGNLVLIYAVLELAALAAWVLLVSSRDGPRRQSAGAYFLLNFAASGLLLLGIALLYGLTGATNLAEIRTVLASNYLPADPTQAVGGPSRLGIAAGVLIFAGLGFRLAFVPFHLGQPRILSDADEWTAGVLMTLPRIGPLVVMVRLLVDAWAGYEFCGEVLALVLAVSTIVIGNARAWTEAHVPAVLAYLAIAQLGYVLAGVAVGFWDAGHEPHSLHASFGFPGGIAAAAFFGAALLPAACGFSCFLIGRGASRRLLHTEQLHGWFSQEPISAGSAGLLLLSLAGLPLTPGFWGRWLLLASTLSVQSEAAHAGDVVPNPAFMLLTLVMLAGWLMTAAVCLRLMFAIFFEEPVSGPGPPAGQAALTAVILTAALTLAWGLLPGPSLELLERLQQPEPAGGAPER